MIRTAAPVVVVGEAELPLPVLVPLFAGLVGLAETVLLTVVARLVVEEMTDDNVTVVDEPVDVVTLVEAVTEAVVETEVETDTTAVVVLLVVLVVVVAVVVLDAPDAVVVAVALVATELEDKAVAEVTIITLELPGGPAGSPMPNWAEGVPNALPEEKTSS